MVGLVGREELLARVVFGRLEPVPGSLVTVTAPRHVEQRVELPSRGARFSSNPLPNNPGRQPLVSGKGRLVADRRSGTSPGG